MKHYIPEGATINVRDPAFVAMFVQIDVLTVEGVKQQRALHILQAARDKARALHRLAKMDGDASAIEAAKAAFKVAQTAHIRATLDNEIKLDELRIFRAEFWALLTKLEPDAYDDRLPWTIEWKDSSESLVVLKRVVSEEERKEAMEAAMFGYHTGQHHQGVPASKPYPSGAGNPAGYL